MLPLAIIGSLALSEVLLIGLVALLAFGGRLPEIAVRAAAQFVRVRKTVRRMWRDAGLEQELRRVRHEIESSLPDEDAYDVRYDIGTGPSAARRAVRTTSDPFAEEPLELDDAEEHPEEGAEHEAQPGRDRLGPEASFPPVEGTVAAGSSEPAPADPPPTRPTIPRDDDDGADEAADASPEDVPDEGADRREGTG